MTTGTLFGGPAEGPTPERQQGRARVLVTVKAAPQPSAAYGETVCVAGLRLDFGSPGWIRLYPINFRYLQQDHKFNKYDIVTLDVDPHSSLDSRTESWRPDIASLKFETHVPPWRKRLALIEPFLIDSMCELNRQSRTDPRAPSLAAIRPSTIDGITVEAHPGWTPAEKAKIDAYVGQLTLFGNEDRSPLEAPRWRARYRWRCGDSHCKGHEQGILDWELVAFQRHLPAGIGLAEARAAVEKRWLEEMCGPRRDPIFYVGNQAKRRHVFSVLGVVWPER